MVAGTFHIRRISIYITRRDAVIPALNGTDYERRWMAYHYKQRATLLTDDESKALAFVCRYSSSFSEPSTLDGDEWLQSRSALLFDTTPRHGVISFATFRDSVVVSFARVECPTSCNIHPVMRRHTSEQQRLPTAKLRKPKNRSASLIGCFAPRRGPEPLGIRSGRAGEENFQLLPRIETRFYGRSACIPSPRPAHDAVYSHAPHNDVSVNDGPHIRRWSHKIIIL